MNKLDLTALLERVRNATGPDRELDRALFDALLGGKFWPENGNFFTRDRWGRGEPSPLTASIDAALALVERVLPGWSLRLYRHPSSAYVTLYELGDVQIENVSDRRVVRGPFEDERHNDAFASLAILAALLLALTSNQEGNDEAVR